MKQNITEKLRAFAKQGQEKMKQLSFRSLSGKMFRGTLMALGGITLAAIVLIAGLSSFHEPAYALSFGHKGGHLEGISKDEAIAKAERRFAKLDDNSDGRLTEDEFTHKRWRGDDDDDDNRRGAFVKQMIAQVDGNNDGIITKQEFVAHATARFDSYDADNNGEISEAEADAARDAMREEKRQRMFQLMDTDGNGVISAEEFEAASSYKGKRGRRGHYHDDDDDDYYDDDDD